MMKRKRIIIGALPLSISALMLALSFYPCLSWSNPAVFVSFSVIAPFSAFYGPFLLFTSERKRRLPFLIPGGILTAAGILGWLSSISGAIEVSTTGYWGSSSWCGYNGGYNGDYMMLGLQVMVFFITVVTSFLGGLFTGIGFGKKM
jgi:hypothetical protein